jgi:hypothetical protein
MSDKHYKVFIAGIIFLFTLFNLIPLANGEGNIHIGALEIHPFASIAQKYDDNIFLEPKNEENDDWITTVTLGCGMQMPIVAERQEDFMFRAKYAADIIEFWDETNQSRVDHTISALADFAFANDFTLKLDENFKKTADPPNSELTDLEKRIRNTIQIFLGYIREDISFDLSYGNIRDDYNKLNNLDKYEHIVTATGYYQIFPKTSIFSEYNFGTIAYDDSATNSDSDYHQIRFGLKGEIAPKLTGVIKGGYKYTTYDDSSKEDFRGVTIFGNLTYNLQERSALNIYGERSSVESTYSVNSYFESNKIGLKLEHQLLERLFLVAEGFYQLNKYPEETAEGSETAKRRDHIWNGGVGLRYRIKDWVVTETNYEYKQRDSKFATFDYENNKVTIKVSFLF